MSDSLSVVIPLTGQRLREIGLSLYSLKPVRLWRETAKERVCWPRRIEVKNWPADLANELKDVPQGPTIQPASPSLESRDLFF